MGLCLIGTIAAAHGIAGGLRVHSHSDNRGRFALLQSVLIGTSEDGAIEMRVRKASDDGRRAVLLLEGVADRNSAERLIGQHVWIREDQMLPAPEGTVYVHDLVGCTVITPDGTSRGVIEDVLLLPANDVYVVRDGERETLIPAVPAIVLKRDMEARIITVDALPGLFEDIDAD